MNHLLPCVIESKIRLDRDYLPAQESETRGGGWLPLPKGEGRGEGERGTQLSNVAKISGRTGIHLAAFSFCLLVIADASGGEWKFPCPEDKIASYTAYHISEALQIDGHLEEAAWQHAPRSPRYVDLITGKPAIHDTRAAVLWDDENLYIGVRLEEPFVHAKFTTNNSPIYYDNDVEVFIAGQDAYYEFEVNAFNTTYEAFFIWGGAYEQGFANAPGLEQSSLK